MRKQYLQVFRTFFHEKLLRARGDLGLTQEAMACRLAMASRTYIDLDHGKNSCSGLTLALFLIYICSDPAEFLEELRKALEEADNEAA